MKILNVHNITYTGVYQIWYAFQSVVSNHNPVKQTDYVESYVIELDDENLDEFKQWLNHYYGCGYDKEIYITGMMRLGDVGEFNQ